MKLLGVSILFLSAALSLSAQENTVSLNQFSKEVVNTKVGNSNKQEMYKLDVENYLRVRDEDKQFYIPHTRKLKLELVIKRSFLKVKNKKGTQIKLA